MGLSIASIMAAALAAGSLVGVVPAQANTPAVDYRTCAKGLLKDMDRVGERLEMVESFGGLADELALSSLEIAYFDVKWWAKRVKNAETRSLMKAYVRVGRSGVSVDDLYKYQGLYEDIMENVNRGRC